jgi:ribosome-associated protein
MNGPPSIPERDLEFRFVRGAGPGGQNVNKVATAVQLRFDLAATAALPEAVKARFRALAGRRLGADGSVLIVARNHRTQEGNRREALMRLRELIATAWVEPLPRRATRPTRASKERRIDHKTRRKRLKLLRGPVQSD